MGAGSYPALNVPRLACQELGFVVPLQGGGRHGGELAVEHGLLIPQHHQVLGGDHWPREALICAGKETKNVCMISIRGHRTIKLHRRGPPQS